VWLINAPSWSSDEGKEREPGVFHGLGYKENLGELVLAGPPHGGGGAEWPQKMAGQPAIFTDGAPAPPVISLASSKKFSRFVNVIKAHDMTLAGGAAFNDGIFFAAIIVDRALMGSMAEERMNKSFGREVREKEMGWGILKGENPSFSSEFYHFTIWTLISQLVECNGKRLNQKGPKGRLGGQEVWPASHTLPLEIMGIFPKFPYKLLNSLLSLILEIWKENFEKAKS
jgi:hypothetical protein